MLREKSVIIVGFSRGSGTIRTRESLKAVSNSQTSLPRKNKRSRKELARISRSNSKCDNSTIS